ncbi:hypothetical protein VTN02DRAFT_6113 [Thermoascus thermophilus]
MHSNRWRFPYSRLWIVLVSPILGFLLLRQLLNPRWDAHVPYWNAGETHPAPNHSHVGHPDCRPVPGMEDVLVVIKTGVTEALDKVPVHYRTTLRCVPHYVIFSDFEEQIAGVRAHDVLRNVSREIKQTNPDFDIYNRLREHGRAGLQDSDRIDEANSPSGKLNNPGWKLDKWKFLPMVDEALRSRPDAKWYFFMEADTYPFWPNLMAWLARFDAEKPLYIGSQMQIGDVTFAYGGAGIILSNPAMRLVSAYRAAHLAEIDELTAAHWAGDCVLGKVLHDAGVSLLWAWPMMQTSTIWGIDFFADAYGRQAWCYPAVSFHHMTPADIELLWQFDQQWFGENGESLLLHRDAFRELVAGDIRAPLDDWDNFSDDAGDVTDDGQQLQSFASMSDCQARCTKDPECLQYAFKDGKCLTSKAVKRGVGSADVQSAWMTDRIHAKLRKKTGSCSTAQWILR